MPSVGRIKQVAVLGGVAAGLAVGASSASAANEVWLWACQGPAGQSLNTAFQGGSGDCASGITLTQPSSLNAGGNVLAFPSVPGNTQISQVKLTRSFTGFGQAGSTSSYSAYTSGATLETAALSGAAPADGTLDKSVTPAGGNGDDLRLKLTCASGPCSTPATVKVTGAAVKVVEASNGAPSDDTATAPAIAVGGKSSPAAGDIALDVRATDAGVGLDSAVAYLATTDTAAAISPAVTFKFADQLVDNQMVYNSCRDLTPDTATVDLPLGALCPTVGKASLVIPTTDGNKNPLYTNGNYTLVVRVKDLSGRETIFREGGNLPVVELLNNPNLGQSSQQLSIGTSGLATQQGSTTTNPNGGGVAGASATQCTSPRLSVELAQKPMRVTKGVPVLQRSKRYLFRGRLTCVVNGKRQSAPKRARIDLQNKVGKKTTDVSGTTVAAKGAFKIILSYTKSRTLIFRFTNSEGKRAQVSIKIKVEKKKAKR